MNWQKIDKVFKDYDIRWNIIDDREVQIEYFLESGGNILFVFPLDKFPYNVLDFAKDFDEEEYAAEVSFSYNDVDLEDLIVEGNEIKDMLYSLAYDLKFAEEEGA